MNVLISSFEPFGGEEINPSQEVTKALKQEYETITLPVTRHLAPELLLERAEDLNSEIIIMLGEAGGSPEIKLERVAINIDDFPIPDHQENQPREEPIIADAPAAYFSTLPLAAIKDTLNSNDIPCSISNSAGTYLCNHLFYTLRHHLDYTSTQIGFIHLPYLPDQAKNKPTNTSSMDLDTMIRAVKSIVQTTMENTIQA